MDEWVKINFFLFCCMLAPLGSYAQNSLSVSFPMILSDVTVRDNWTPSTAPFYKEYLSGSALGYGINFNYSFQPKFLIKDKHFTLIIGAGYFIQRFDVRRPFSYNSPIEIIYYTDYYLYHCWQWIGGLTYSYPLNKYNLVANMSFTQFYSFRQEYTPTRKDFSTQVNSDKIDFGKMLSLSVGVNRYLGKRFLLGLNLLIPIYSRWRNDRIFNDDPATFYQPESSVGLYISVAYHLKEKL